MKPRRGVVASLSSAIVVVLVAIAWIAFAPPQLGGQTSYVIVNGNSMEPGMHRGDLAIVRKSGSYHVGEVVTYRHPQIGPVIHRIVGVDGDHYVFKGDHNSFVDSYHPTQQELIGGLWIHIPGVGAWLTRFHSPFYMAGLLFLAFVGFGGVAAIRGSSEPSTRREAQQPARQELTRGDTPMQQLLRNWQDTLSVLAAAAIALCGLAWVSLHRPADHQVPANIPYAQSGTFGYSAAAADGRVYDGGQAATGDPVYRRLSEQVGFTFAYKLDAQNAANISGTYHLVAELGDRSGWRRTVELGPETPFTGNSFSGSGVLNLAEAQELISVLEQQSGVKNDHYTVSIKPDVSVRGTIKGEAFEDQFSPVLPMTLDALQLSLVAPNGNVDPLKPSANGLVSTLQTKTNTIQILAFALPVPLARLVSVGGLGLLLAFAGWLVMASVNARRSPSAPVLASGARLRSPLVNVRGAVPQSRSRVIDVASLDDMGRIAARLGAVVLQEARPGYHAYFVHDGDLTYRFEAVGKQTQEDGESRRSA
jgi:signal peptidase